VLPIASADDSTINGTNINVPSHRCTLLRVCDAQLVHRRPVAQNRRSDIAALAALESHIAQVIFSISAVTSNHSHNMYAC
jgi:hypothetical protein